MFVPSISKRASKTILSRRAGGGGGGSSGGTSGGGKGGSSGGGSSGSGKGGSSGGGGGGGGKGGGSSGSNSGGSTPLATVSEPARQYGSGYPGITGRGVAGRSFPFIFWPIAWEGVAGVGTAAYLHGHEYGDWDNITRPGGVLMTAAFSSLSQNTTFRLLSDKSTVVSLIEDIKNACSSKMKSPETTTLTTYNDILLAPKPEQAVQYYRASTVVLTLDGYNSTAVFESEGTPDVPIPVNINTGPLDCLNKTIGDAVPLVDAHVGPSHSAPPNAPPVFSGGNPSWRTTSPAGLVGAMYLIWCLSVLI